MNSMKRPKDRTLKDELQRSIGTQYATGECRNSSRGMKRLSQSRNNTQLWMCLVLKVKSSSVKSKYCIGIWNVRSMNQGKLEVVKREMARTSTF